MITPDQMAQKLLRAAFKLKFEIDTEVRAAAKEGADYSKSLIGSGAPGWPDLSPVTIERKDAAGYATPAPLLREGELRDSIDSEAEVTGEGAEGLIYSTDEVAVYQELGTGSNPQGSPVPPRPFLMKGAMKAVEAVEPKLIEALERAINS